MPPQANKTPFSKAEFGARLAKTKQRMGRAGIDTLIVSDPANMNYLTGYDGWSFYVHQAAIVALDLDQPLWIGRGQDANGARLTTILRDENIHGYSDDQCREQRQLASYRSAWRPHTVSILRRRPA